MWKIIITAIVTSILTTLFWGVTLTCIGQLAIQHDAPQVARIGAIFERTDQIMQAEQEIIEKYMARCDSNKPPIDSRYGSSAEEILSIVVKQRDFRTVVIMRQTELLTAMITATSLFADFGTEISNLEQALAVHETYLSDLNSAITE